jgi:hypothetical protein
MECSLVQSLFHTEICLLEDTKCRAVLILAGLLTIFSTVALNARDNPPSSSNAIQGYTTCKGPLEGKFSATPVAYMKDSTP